jgi:hypothetical protein
MIFNLLLIITGALGAYDASISFQGGMTPTLSLKMNNIDNLPLIREGCNITLDEHILIHCSDFVLLDSFKHILASYWGYIYNSDVLD